MNTYSKRLALFIQQLEDVLPWRQIEEVAYKTRDYIHIDTSRPVIGCVECGNEYAEGYCPHSPRDRAGA